MPASQIIVGALLVLVLGWFGGNTILRQIKAFTDGSNHFQLPMLVRLSRFYSGIIMLVLGGMLFWGLMFLEVPAQNLADLRDLADERGAEFKFTPEQRSFASTYAKFWLAFLALLFSMVCSSSLDAIFTWNCQRKKNVKSWKPAVCEANGEIQIPRSENNSASKEYWGDGLFPPN